MSLSMQPLRFGRLLLSVAALTTITGCVNHSITTQPVSYFINPELGPTEPLPGTTQGVPNSAEAEKHLTVDKSVRPMLYTTCRSSDKSSVFTYLRPSLHWGKPVGDIYKRPRTLVLPDRPKDEFEKQFDRDAEQEWILFSVTDRQAFEFNQAQHISGAYNVSGAYVASGQSEGEVRYEAQVIFKENDPFFNLRFSISPILLVSEERAASDDVSIAYLFFSGIGAPRFASVKTLVDVSGNFAFLSFLKGQSSFNEAGSQNWAQRYVLCKFNDQARVDAVKEAMKSQNFRMFKTYDLKTPEGQNAIKKLLIVGMTDQYLFDGKDGQPRNIPNCSARLEQIPGEPFIGPPNKIGVVNPRTWTLYVVDELYFHHLIAEHVTFHIPRAWRWVEDQPKNEPVAESTTAR